MTPGKPRFRKEGGREGDVWNQKYSSVFSAGGPVQTHEIQRELGLNQVARKQNHKLKKPKRGIVLSKGELQKNKKETSPTSVSDHPNTNTGGDRCKSDQESALMVVRALDFDGADNRFSLLSGQVFELPFMQKMPSAAELAFKSPSTMTSKRLRGHLHKIADQQAHEKTRLNKNACMVELAYWSKVSMNPEMAKQRPPDFHAIAKLELLQKRRTKQLHHTCQESKDQHEENCSLATHKTKSVKDEHGILREMGLEVCVQIRKKRDKSCDSAKKPQSGQLRPFFSEEEDLGVSKARQDTFFSTAFTTKSTITPDSTKSRVDRDKPMDSIVVPKVKFSPSTDSTFDSTRNSESLVTDLLFEVFSPDEHEETRAEQVTHLSLDMDSHCETEETKSASEVAIEKTASQLRNEIPTKNKKTKKKGKETEEKRHEDDLLAEETRILQRLAELQRVIETGEEKSKRKRQAMPRGTGPTAPRQQQKAHEIKIPKFGAIYVPVLQRWVRGQLRRNEFVRQRRAALRIQNFWRTWSCIRAHRWVFVQEKLKIAAGRSSRQAVERRIQLKKVVERIGRFEEERSLKQERLLMELELKRKEEQRKRDLIRKEKERKTSEALNIGDRYSGRDEWPVAHPDDKETNIVEQAILDIASSLAIDQDTVDAVVDFASGLLQEYSAVRDQGQQLLKRKAGQDSADAVLDFAREFFQEYSTVLHQNQQLHKEQTGAEQRRNMDQESPHVAVEAVANFAKGFFQESSTLHQLDQQVHKRHAGSGQPLQTKEESVRNYSETVDVVVDYATEFPPKNSSIRHQDQQLHKGQADAEHPQQTKEERVLDYSKTVDAVVDFATEFFQKNSTIQHQDQHLHKKQADAKQPLQMTLESMYNCSNTVDAVADLASELFRETSAMQHQDMNLHMNGVGAAEPQKHNQKSVDDYSNRAIPRCCGEENFVEDSDCESVVEDSDGGSFLEDSDGESAGEGSDGESAGEESDGESAGEESDGESILDDVELGDEEKYVAQLLLEQRITRLRKKACLVELLGWTNDQEAWMKTREDNVSPRKS